MRIYKLISKRKKMHGAIYLGYSGGTLCRVEMVLNKPLTGEQYQWLMARVPYTDEDVEGSFGTSSMEVKLLEPRSVQDKIVLFSSYYKHHRGVSYQAKTVEKANVKTVPVSGELLEMFFSSPLSNYTLANYISRINITRDWVTNGANTQRWPPYYDAQVDRSLSENDRRLYYKYLRKRGWKQVYHPVSGTRWEN